MSQDKPHKATPCAELNQRLMDPHQPRSEIEHYARLKILILKENLRYAKWQTDEVMKVMYRESWPTSMKELEDKIRRNIKVTADMENRMMISASSEGIGLTRKFVRRQLKAALEVK